MPVDSLDTGAAARLRRAFEGLVALERLGRAFEGLVIGASGAWVLLGLARLQGEAAARGALAPAALAGLLAAASWWIERWRSPREIAARADRLLATPQLLDTALEAPAKSPAGWSELLARRALARFDRTRLRLAAAPAWAAAAALALLAAGAHEWLLRCAPSALPSAPLVRAWSDLASGLEAGVDAPAQPAAQGHAQLLRALREAAALESRGELGAAAARALLERAAAELAAGPQPSGSDPSRTQAASASLAQLGQAYGRQAQGSGSVVGAAAGGVPPSGAGSGVPSTDADGTMGGSAESGSGRLPAPPGPAVGGGEGALRPTLSARWWPRDQDGLVEAWIARQPRARRPR